MIKVGTCGWGFFKGGFRAFIQKFSLVEVQHTLFSNYFMYDNARQLMKILKV